MDHQEPSLSQELREKIINCMESNSSYFKSVLEEEIAIWLQYDLETHYKDEQLVPYSHIAYAKNVILEYL